MDSFYAAVEQQRDPALRGKPTAVVQYNPHGDLKSLGPDDNRRVDDSNGSIIAVSYEARPYGVKRQMMGVAAKALCPSLCLVQVPTKHRKADLNLYRESGARVVSILSRGGVCERASIDEAYIDLTEQACDLLSRAEREADAWQATVAEVAGSWVAGSEAGSSGGGGGGGDGGSNGGSNTAGDSLPKGSGSCESEDSGGQDTDGGNVSGKESHGTEGAAGVGAASSSTVAAETAAAAAAVDPAAASASDSAKYVAAASAEWLARPEEAWAPEEKLLVCGAAVAARLQAAVSTELGYTCSGGIAHNKMLAKLASGMHKPNQQTIVPSCCLEGLLRELPISRIGGFGGDLGRRVCEVLGITTLGELSRQPEPLLRRHFGEETASRLAQVSRGQDYNPVKVRARPNSVGCSKTFFRGTALVGLERVGEALVGLAAEVTERLALEEQQGRTARRLVVHWRGRVGNGEARDLSRRRDIRGGEDTAKLAAEALSMVKAWAANEGCGPSLSFTVDVLGLSAEAFEERPTGVPDITSFFGGERAQGQAPAAGAGAAAVGAEAAAAAAAEAALAAPVEGVTAPTPAGPSPCGKGKDKARQVVPLDCTGLAVRHNKEAESRQHGVDGSSSSGVGSKGDSRSGIGGENGGGASASLFPAGGSSSNSSSSRPRQPEQDYSIDPAVVDPEVLKELPPALRRQLEYEMGLSSRGSSGKKEAGGIQRFCKPGLPMAAAAAFGAGGGGKSGARKAAAPSGSSGNGKRRKGGKDAAGDIKSFFMSAP